MLFLLCGGAWLEKQNRWLNLPSWLRYTIIMIVKGFHILKDKLTGGGTSISISSRHKSYFKTSWWYIYSSAFLNMGKKWNVRMIVQYVSLKSCPGQKLVCCEKVDFAFFWTVQWNVFGSVQGRFCLLDRLRYPFCIWTLRLWAMPWWQIKSKELLFTPHDGSHFYVI